MSWHRAVIVGAAPRDGATGFYRRLIEAEGDLVVAADDGLAVCCAAGRMPDVCVGDFDSVEPALLERARVAGSVIVTHPREKDRSDLDLAVSEARARGVEDLVLTACLAGRIDHSLAVLGTLSAAADLRATLREPSETLYALGAGTRPEMTLQEPPGTIVSLFAIGGDAVVSAEGFRYALDALTLPVLSSRGLSNISVSVRQHIRVEQGCVVVVVNCSPDVSTAP